MRPLVIGLGQRLAGDDGVGLVVAALLREEEDLEIAEINDASALVSMLRTRAPVCVVDAVIGPPGSAGRVRVLAPEALGAPRLSFVSTHGVDVGQAIALARELFGDEASPSVSIVGITIERAERLREGLSPAVAAAAHEAARVVRGRLVAPGDG